MNINSYGQQPQFFQHNVGGGQGPRQHIIRHQQDNGQFPGSEGPRQHIIGPQQDSGQFPGGPGGMGGRQFFQNGGGQQCDNHQGLGLQGLNFGYSAEGQDGAYGQTGSFDQQGFPGFPGGQGPQFFQNINGGQRPDPAQLYTKLDADGDGKLTQAELDSGRPENAPEPSDDMKTDFWNRADADQSGDLSEEEFAQAGPAGGGPRVMLRQMGDPSEIYGKLDADGDGNVTQAELDSGRPENAPELSDDMKTAMWNHLDADQSGGISEEEFANAAPPPPPQIGNGSNGFGNMQIGFGNNPFGNMQFGNFQQYTQPYGYDAA